MPPPSIRVPITRALRHSRGVGSRVVEQSPAAGEKAKRGSGVRLLLNLF